MYEIFIGMKNILHNINNEEYKQERTSQIDCLFKMLEYLEEETFSKSQLEEAYRNGWLDRDIGQDTFHIEKL